MKLKKIILAFFLSINFFNAQTEINNLESKTFIGLEISKKGEYSYAKCEGEYAVLRFKKNNFYYYHPQEGTNYIIKELKKTSDTRFEIITDGYYFFQGDKPLQESAKWVLNKKLNYIWEFEKESTGDKFLFIDSLDLKKIKIRHIECVSNKYANKISQKWLGVYSKSLSRNKKTKEPRDTEAIELVIKKDSVIFNVDRYMGSYSLLLNANEKNGKLFLTFDSVLNDEESNLINDKKDFGFLTNEKKKYYWYCPYISHYYHLTDKKIIMKRE